MFEKIRKMKNQKGFTLVELIVVLVILAILAAMLVPALTGYIDKANNEKIIATTRQVVMAAQTEVSEAYAKETLAAGKLTIETGNVANQGDTNKIADLGKKVVELAEVGDFGTTTESKYTLKNGIETIVIEYGVNGHVTSVVLTQGSKVCTYVEDASKMPSNQKYTSGNYGVKAK